MKVFRKVPSLSFMYEINEDGVVRNVKSKKVLATQTDSYGYKVVHTYRKGALRTCKVHRLVLECWGPPNPEPEVYTSVDHVDRNKANNNIRNLRWATPQMQADNSAWNTQAAQAHTTWRHNHIEVWAKMKKPCALEKDGETYIFDSKESATKFLGLKKINNNAVRGDTLVKGFKFTYLEKVERLFSEEK